MRGLYFSQKLIPKFAQSAAPTGILSGRLDRVSTVSAPTALYRRYRPDSFATVIGQEHVTGPLMAALEKNRVNHAYLFSGPRGCGKTTSARILARCLNCAKGPTANPCGECDSCVELARGGSGSLDVIEIDAASHGGVDDARDLRERATFAPIRDRYKIFIIDEAHMVTSAGFNALLKIVEEPPEHIKFIFATTEPDKVIGTIRSRTHHYPFRLVPPEPLMAYLAQLCEQEQVAVAPGVLSLVVRAGGGSVRDSLSVLDQLMAGAGAAGLDYDLAIDLLGYTHSSLLDDVVEALAASDSATVFKSVDRVVQTGHDPRRFVEDLLERFRDLIIVQAMPESAHAILRGTPDELIARMQTQAAQLGAAELSRAADVTNAAFNEMTGATSPRLHLELLGARLLLPGTDSSVRGMATRLDQLERRLNYAGTPIAAPAGNPGAGAAQAAQPAQAPAPEHFAPQSSTPFPADPAGDTSGGGLAAVRAQLARAKEAAGAEVAARRAPAAAPTQDWATTANQPQTPAQAPTQQEPAAAQTAPTWDDLPTPAENQKATTPQSSAQEPDAPTTAATKASTGATAPTVNTAPAAPGQGSASNESAGAVSTGSSGIEVIRRAWPEILGALRSIRMASWAMVNQNVVPQVFDGRELRVGLPSSGLIETFSNNGHLENLQQAINQVLGMSVQILPADGEAPATRASAEPNPKVQPGNPSQEREGDHGNATAPENVAAQQERPTAAPAPVRRDSWGLPIAEPTDANPAQKQPQPGESAETQPSPGTQKPTLAQAPWDGPTEPSDLWDEPHPDSYPPADYAPADPYDPSATHPEAGSHQQPAQETSTGSLSEEQPASEKTPVPAYSPPKVSPISAWTTGWDTPAAAPVSAAPMEAEAPRRSAMLAEQIAQRSDQQGNQPAQPDWSASLGQTSRQNVADPGWGSISNAPDWAQGTTKGAGQDSSSDAGQGGNTGLSTGSNAASEAGLDTARDEAASAEVAEESPGASSSITETTPPQAPGFNTAQQTVSSPLGASNTYPTVATVSLPASPVEISPVETDTAQQEAPAPEEASNSAAQAGAKQSMYHRLSNSTEAQAARAQAPSLAAPKPYVEDVPSPDDVTLEESGVVGQAAVERILGGVLIEERQLNPSN